LIDTDRGHEVTRLTSMYAEVTEIVKWTADNQVYYVSTLPANPGARHLFKLQIGAPFEVCRTCNIHQQMVPRLQRRGGCEYVDISMSEGGSFYMGPIYLTLPLFIQGPTIFSTTGIKILTLNSQLPILTYP